MPAYQTAKVQIYIGGIRECAIMSCAKKFGKSAGVVGSVFIYLLESRVVGGLRA